eukprot:CAMPEP_0115509316 /NCGR_PEP_ID=MMETSP0271-20121206/72786_1 /TAXON_ID=71861 /ORGANISM="Scrippsiella trochoidea, Strain CCMP3099" /LENGTH=620 /DNA_ID=CAMNT_0002939149 /DNA_START=27 /DNA_END=1890 /DNA_ORIENTATION=+
MSSQVLAALPYGDAAASAAFVAGPAPRAAGAQQQLTTAAAAASAPQPGFTWSSGSGAAVGFALSLAAVRRARRTHHRRSAGAVARCAVAEKEPSTTTEQTEEARPVFPFAAIVGQSEMKLALILNVIDPKIGGVMILGDRGTGKTTTIRALVDLLPEIETVADDPYNSSPTEFDNMSDEVRNRKAKSEELPIVLKKVPMIDLPLGATEDRVCGTIDIEKALTQGKKAFEPGLLARANRGILYVDEVNLLDDHLVDVLLDSAAGGWNTVEREGISVRHPAKFILVGSGNPEEGELRPQLLDRFGMHAMIRTERDPELRVQIVEGCQQFADDPKGFRAQYAGDNAEFAKQIIVARNNLNSVTISPEIRRKISEVCSDLNVDGLRGDIVTNRAARAFCAFDGRTEVTDEDVKKVVTLCLRHRLRKDVLDTMDNGEKVGKAYEAAFEEDLALCQQPWPELSLSTHRILPYAWDCIRTALLPNFELHAFASERDPELRVQIVEGCQQFADDPKGFRAQYSGDNAEFAKQIIVARSALNDVTVSPEIRRKISEVCSDLNVDGLRGDIVTNRAARAFCAFDGRSEVTDEDVKKVITLCLRHRLRKDVLDTMDNGDKVMKAYEAAFEE